jgi:hypothetical protein
MRKSPDRDFRMGMRQAEILTTFFRMMDCPIADCYRVSTFMHSHKYVIANVMTLVYLRNLYGRDWG